MFLRRLRKECGALLRLLPLVLATNVLAADALTEVFQKALFEEEANQNLKAAISGYEAVVARLDEQRKLAATAVFRLGECYRKLGRTNEAAAQYQRILDEFSEQATLVNLSRQNLVGLGRAAGSGTSARSGQGRQEQQRLLEAEIQLTIKELDRVKELFAQNVVSQAQVDAKQRDLLRLQRQLAALADADPAEAAGPATQLRLQYETDRALLARVQKLSDSERRLLLPSLLSDPLLPDLLKQQQQTELRLTQLREQFGQEHPEVRGAVSTLKELTGQIDQRLEVMVRSLEQRVEASRAALAAAGVAVERSAGDTAITDEEEKEIRRIQALIKNSPDLINAPAQQEKAPLHTAAEAGYVQVVKFLLSNGADVQARTGSSGWTAMHFAASRGHKSIVELLIGARADVNAAARGTTPLHLAAQRNFRQVIDLLLTNGANLNAQDVSGATPLHLAVLGGHDAVIEWLLSQGADPNLRIGQHAAAGDGIISGRTALHSAAARRSGRIVSLLLKHRAELEAKDEKQATPLFIAIETGAADAVEALLAAGAEANVTGASGVSALHRAVTRGDPKILSAVLARKPNLEAWNDDGQTPLLQAAANPQQLQISNVVALLLAAGADPNASKRDVRTTAAGPQRPVRAVMPGAPPGMMPPGFSSFQPSGTSGDKTAGWTPLSFAIFNQRPDLVDLLLRHQADPNRRVPHYGGELCQNHPPLLMAVVLGNQEMVRTLLAYKADAQRTNDCGLGALQRAVLEGQVEMVEALLRHGANPNARTGTGESVLHLAAKQTPRGAPRVLELLLAHKANPNDRDHLGSTPLHYAASNGDTVSARQLLDHGAELDILNAAGETPLSLTSLPSRDAQMVAGKKEIATLLRQRGANPAAQRPFVIAVTRASRDFRQSIFAKGTNRWNRYTLIELLATAYSSGARRSLPFPDLARLTIRRLKPGGGEEHIVADHARLVMGDCSNDVWLEWGDEVELPEAEHGLQEQWPGFAGGGIFGLSRCLSRSVSFVVRGQTNRLGVGTVVGSWDIGPLRLKDVLQQSGLASSVSARTSVKVTRKEPNTGEPREMILNLEAVSPESDLWLRDGDVIELPPPSSDSPPAAPPQPVPGIPSPAR